MLIPCFWSVIQELQKCTYFLEYEFMWQTWNSCLCCMKYRSFNQVSSGILARKHLRSLRVLWSVLIFCEPEQVNKPPDALLAPPGAHEPRVSSSRGWPLFTLSLRQWTRK
jgi:hypothetical protein